mmetsp:Transcript_10335/g.23178  ORF Transcript_10335/g.23178 Transcript_10335/m.23178 type:complete len:511 (+) Transcript_10335:27-1559(+)
MNTTTSCSSNGGGSSSSSTRRREGRSALVLNAASTTGKGWANKSTKHDHLHADADEFRNKKHTRISFEKRKRDIICLASMVLGILSFLASAAAILSGMDTKIKSESVLGRGIGDLSLLGYQPKPRAMGYYFIGASDSILKGKPQRMYTYYERYPTKRLIHITERAVEAQRLLRRSRHYRLGQAEPFETRECRRQYEWQLMSHPTCNSVHETDVNDLHAETGKDERARIIASGFWRDTWMVRGFEGDKSALKTMRYEHGFEARNFDRHRRDALASERLTSSNNVVDIHLFCGNSAVFEFASGGDINDAIWPLQDQNGNLTLANRSLTSLERLGIALQVSTALADVHNIDQEGRPSLAHTDITPSQFIMIDGKYKLNDFNRCRFIRWNRTDDKPCSYFVGRNPGKFRSPEEYSNAGQTEKVDIYSMGNVFYALLTEYWPFEGMEEKKAQEMILSGERPHVDAELLNSKDSADVALIEAMRMCWRQDPIDRATATDVKQYLTAAMKRSQRKQE